MVFYIEFVATNRAFERQQQYNELSLDPKCQNTAIFKSVLISNLMSISKHPWTAEIVIEC